MPSAVSLRLMRKSQHGGSLLIIEAIHEAFGGMRMATWESNVATELPMARLPLQRWIWCAAKLAAVAQVRRIKFSFSAALASL